MTANYEIDYDVAMPDTSIGFSEMNLYGYKGADMLPLLTDRALELFDADHTIYMLYENATEAMVFEREEITAHDGIFGIEASEWIASLEYADIIKTLYNSKSSKKSALMNDNYSAMYDDLEKFDHTIEKPQTAHADTSEQIAPEKDDKQQPVHSLLLKRSRSQNLTKRSSVPYWRRLKITKQARRTLRKASKTRLNTKIQEKFEAANQNTKKKSPTLKFHIGFLLKHEKFSIKRLLIYTILFVIIFLN